MPLEGRRFQFGQSNCERIARVPCRPGLQDRMQPVWRASPFEPTSAYGGSTLKPVIDEAIFWQLKRPVIWPSRARHEGRLRSSPSLLR